MDDVMTVAEALTELLAVGADAKPWQPHHGARLTIYVNGAKIAEIWADSLGNVKASSVWSAIHKHITSTDLEVRGFRRAQLEMGSSY